MRRLRRTTSRYEGNILALVYSFCVLLAIIIDGTTNGSYYLGWRVWRIYHDTTIFSRHPSRLLLCGGYFLGGVKDTAWEWQYRPALRLRFLGADPQGGD